MENVLDSYIYDTGNTEDTQNAQDIENINAYTSNIECRTKYTRHRNAYS